MVSLKIANDEHINEEEDLVKENDALKQEIVEINLRHIEEINNIRLVRYNNALTTSTLKLCPLT